ncbi:LacI family DNA-binding transcriptional regulator [Heyndrickxia camelliae]|uniref:LacI family transcriptional regulator n=1 Tax=Heyndrickxia camelliae TaxID=1707093 RepID=A0A2N3LPD9_9BACI|nr:substrate-binding domain-containing protein [Heyndrickxia camelliae]PKR86424.1 LacI family transcriptional regulator [Heyndrickxia camelliae]
MKKITIADVAKHANVSKSTVSQYLNERFEYMSEKTRKKIKDTIEELNYQPNILARSLKQKSTFTIGVVVANNVHTFTTNVIRAIEGYFYQEGFHIIVCNADDEPQKEKNYIEMLRAKQVDGIIIFPTGDNLDLYQQMIQDRFPIVFMDRTITDLDITTVLLDNHLAAKLAVDHFVEKGYRNIAIVTTSIIRNISPRIERIQGYREALQSHGIAVKNEYIKTAPAEEISTALSELFSLETPPEAVLAGNDRVLNEVLRFIKSRDFKIPDDVAVIGIDEVPYADFYTPTITTVKQPTDEMAHLAAEQLLAQIKQEEDRKPGVHRLKPTLIPRFSC